MGQEGEVRREGEGEVSGTRGGGEGREGTRGR